MKMDWSKDHVLQLIELVRRRPCLYNVEHESFLNKKERIRAASDLAKTISHLRPGTTIEEILKKWDELCAQFLSKHEHILQSRRGTISRPFYYDKMSFVLDYISPKPSPKLLLEKREDKDKSTLKCLFEKDVVLTDERKLVSVKEKISSQQNPPAEPAARTVPIKLRPGMPLGSDEESISCFSFQSPKVDSSGGSLPSQKRGTSDALLSSVFVSSRDRSSSSTQDIQIDARSDEDEDTLYMKYVLCRLKKLEEAQKVKLKFEIDKLFYQVLATR